MYIGVNSYTHKHTYTHTHSHPLTHTHTHPVTHIHTHTPCTHTPHTFTFAQHTHTHDTIHMHTFLHALILLCTLGIAHKYSHMQCHTHVHTHTHTHSHICSRAHILTHAITAFNSGMLLWHVWCVLAAEPCLHWGVDPHGYMYVWRYSMEEYRIEVSYPSSLVGSPLGAMPSAETLKVVPLPTGGAAARKDPVERGKEPMNSQRPAAKLGANSEKSVPEDSKSDPFVLGEGLPILPAKLTAKILRSKFVEMHELLQDNIALEKKVADELTTLNQGTKQSKNVSSRRTCMVC